MPHNVFFWKIHGTSSPTFILNSFWKLFDRYEGFNVDLVHAISEILGFNYTISEVSRTLVDFSTWTIFHRNVDKERNTEQRLKFWFRNFSVSRLLFRKTWSQKKNQDNKKETRPSKQWKFLIWILIFVCFVPVYLMEESKDCYADVLFRRRRKT